MSFDIDPASEGFESGLGGWVAADVASSVALVSPGHSGSQCMEVTDLTGSIADTPAALLPATAIVGTHPISGGTYGEIIVGGWYLLPVGAPAIDQAVLVLTVYDVTATQIAVASNVDNITAGTWTYLEVSVVLPAGADTVSVFCQGANTGTAVPLSAVLDWDDFTYEGHTLVAPSGPVGWVVG